MKFLAKSVPVQTLKEHTDELLERYKKFKEIYQAKLYMLNDNDWKLLELAIKYHDVGKADTVFQNKIRKNIGLSPLKANSLHDIPHNLLSVLAIPFKKLGLKKEEERLLAQVVGYHHERGPLPEQISIKENYQLNILPIKGEVENELGIEIDAQARAGKINKLKNRYLPTDENYNKYILMKGLLHRFDHAASADVPIELATEMNVGGYVSSFFAKNKFAKKPLQQFTESHQDRHLVVVAQTGMGKTEAGLLWLGNEKGFFTLPLRVSINAMYSRIRSEKNLAFTKVDEEFGEQAVGLLHSTSLDYLYDQVKEGDDGVLEKAHSQSKEFANKLVISTIDQILKFPFYYLGFEKEYATMATAKVIIDELQAYDPKIAAVLVRALTMIDQIGGSFMIMTATLPDFYYKALQKELRTSKLPIAYEEFIDDTVKRHRVLVRDEQIVDEHVIEEIKLQGEKKKVLVICNTVDKACEVFRALKDAQVRLLHARFIQKDRARLEKQLIDFAESDEYGIWVTTQLVEASLDIDFDVLYTEMSSLDSQFQRYGRCNRKGEKLVEEANVHVFTNEASGVSKSDSKGGVYNYEIYQYSIQLLKEHSDELLLESVKQSMIQELYDEERLDSVKSSFKKEFDETLYQLKNRPHYDIKKREAQDLLRDILQIQVIPISFTKDEQFQKIMGSWKNAEDKIERRKYRRQLEKYSVSVNNYRAEKIGKCEIEGFKGLYYIHSDYCNETGLMMKVEMFS